MLQKLILISLLGACSTMEQVPSEGVFQKDLFIVSGDTAIRGFGVLPKADSYKLNMRSRKTPEIIRVSNCHRDTIYRDGKYKFAYSYYPNQDVENGSCLLQISFLDNKGYHQFGAVSFVDDETLEAELACNGELIGFKGASVCQAKSGTIQLISFNEKTLVKSSSGCPLPTTTDFKKWSYKINAGFCVYVFRGSSLEIHKHTTFGYNDFVKN